MVTYKVVNYYNLMMKKQILMLRELMLDYEPIENKKKKDLYKIIIRIL
jgi:hypothetical protein